MYLLEGELGEVDSEVDLVVEGHHTGGQAAKLQLAHTESKEISRNCKLWDGIRLRYVLQRYQ
jgi:hypothetical protein